MLNANAGSQQTLRLALQYHQAGNFRQAEELYRQILAAEPRNAEACHFLGLLARQTGHADAAVDLLTQAIGLKPYFPEAYCNLGNAHRDRRRPDEATICYRKAIALKPDFAEAYSNLGNALGDGKRSDEAIACYRQAIALRPDYADAFYNLANVLRETRELDESIACYRRAIELRPDFAEAYGNLGTAMKDSGRLDEAMAAYTQALALKPDLPSVQSNQLMILNYHPDSTAQTIWRHSTAWAARYADSLRELNRRYANVSDPERRLKVGYVSGDFWNHPVGRTFLPLLTAHDRRSVEIFCYAGVQFPDTMTQRIRAGADAWRDIVGLKDQQIADLIREDKIDILVDLALHTSDNRLRVFARKPAPVQATYLAYCSTSGMRAMDYRLTDPYLDPPGVNDGYYSEQSIYLPETYWCYQPTCPTPEPSALPALSAGHVTFGCLNNFCKVSQPALEAWRELLLWVPESRLLLHAHEGSHRRRVEDFLADKGIDPKRLEFASQVPISRYFELYQPIDIALDPFPFAGGTTTCDSLWMGVPVISLAGQTAVSRGGLSILSNVGMAELVARTVQDYLGIARELAGDLPRLAEMRSSLRQKMLASPLMDAPRFARNVEAVYRTMWQRWCAA